MSFRTRLIVSLAVVVCAMSSCTIVSAQSEDTKFEQKIELVDCTVTKTDDGHSVIHDNRCDGASMPKITGPSWSREGQLVISGTYESAVAEKLRVYCFGKWYTLGQDEAIESNGNSWRLNLGKLSLKPGTYKIIAEVVTTNHLLLRDSAYIIVNSHLDGTTDIGSSNEEVAIEQGLVQIKPVVSGINNTGPNNKVYNLDVLPGRSHGLPCWLMYWMPIIILLLIFLISLVCLLLVVYQRKNKHK